MADIRLARTRQAYHPCEIGDAPHRFQDHVNGRPLQHAFRTGITYERVCAICGAREEAVLKAATPEHSEHQWNVIEGDHRHDDDGGEPRP